MHSKRPHIVVQKTVFRPLKGRLLQAKRRPFATRWFTGCYARHGIWLFWRRFATLPYVVKILYLKVKKSILGRFVLGRFAF